MIHNQVRGWRIFGDDTERVRGEIDGEMHQIAETRRLPHSEAPAASPGTGLRRSEASLVVQCGDGPIEIVSWDLFPAGVAGSG